MLSERMEAVVKMVSSQSFVIADVGCDHAYVSIALIKRGLARRVIAMDVRSGPLMIAQKNIEACGEQAAIELRMGDGLERLQPGEADAIILAGMGGLLVKRILEQGMEILSFEKKRPILILQPQSNLREVRIFLYQNAYHIVQETMVLEDGKYYTVIKAEPVLEENGAAGKERETEMVYGRYGLEHRDPVLYEYLRKEQTVLNRVLAKLEQQERGVGIENLPEKTRERFYTIQKELKRNADALEYFCTTEKVEVNVDI